MGNNCISVSGWRRRRLTSVDAFNSLCEVHKSQGEPHYEAYTQPRWPHLTPWAGLNPTWHGPFVAAAPWHAVALNALRSIEYLFDFSFVSSAS